MARRALQRIGIFGGTFDPIHRGHLLLAAAAARRCQLDWIYFVPAADPRHKAAPRASYADRYAMVALALGGRRQWSPLAIPQPAGQPTHSLRQVRWIGRRHPGARLYFILGADAMTEIHTWHRFRELLAACDFIVAPRLGLGPQAVAAALPPGMATEIGTEGFRLRRRRVFWLANFRAPSGSRRLRARLGQAGAKGRPQDLPAAVAAYQRRGRFYS